MRFSLFQPVPDEILIVNLFLRCHTHAGSERLSQTKRVLNETIDTGNTALLELGEQREKMTRVRDKIDDADSFLVRSSKVEQNLHQTSLHPTIIIASLHEYLPHLPLSTIACPFFLLLFISAIFHSCALGSANNGSPGDREQGHDDRDHRHPALCHLPDRLPEILETFQEGVIGLGIGLAERDDDRLWVRGIHRPLIHEIICPGIFFFSPPLCSCF
jgi:hypothetical protein